MSPVKKLGSGYFPVGPVVKTLASDAVGTGSIPGQELRSTCLLAEKNKQEQYCNRFNKDFKNGPH